VGSNSQSITRFDCHAAVMQMKFRNICEVKKRLVEPGLVWSRTLSILLSTNGENVFLPVFGPTLQAILLQAVDKWTAG